MVNIKVVHKDNVRRFNLPPEASWIDLEAKLRTIFHIPKLTPFTLSYTDEDNDVITLSTDIELREIFASNPTIKFNLKFSTSDDSSDSEDNNSDVWVFEGNIKNAAPSTTIETDNSVLQSNVSQKNIISTTNQEPQYVEDDIDIDETSNKKIQVDDDFERVEKSPIDVERIEKLQNDVEREKELPNDVEREKESQNDIEREKESQNDIEREKESQNDVNIVEESPNDVVRVEELPNDVDRVEESPNDVDKVEESSSDIAKLPSGVENVEKLPKDVDRVGRSIDLFVGRSLNNISVEKSDKVESSNYVDRLENLSTKKISRVNLLDDEFFESFNSLSFEPNSLPLLQRETEEDEQEDKETLSSSNSSVFSPFSELCQSKRRQDQSTDNLEELKNMIDQYGATIKGNPNLAASIIEQIRTSADPRPTQSKEDKHTSYFRQHSITSPVSGRSRSSTPPRPDYNRSEHTRSSTSPRPDCNRPSTPEYILPSTPPRPRYRFSPSPSRSGYNRTQNPEYTRPSTTPRSSRYNRHSPSPSRNRSPTPEPDNTTPPQIPGSFPSEAPLDLWIPEQETNSNPKNGRGRRHRRGRARQFRGNRSPRQFTNEGERTQETQNVERTPNREETPETPETPELRSYNEDVKQLMEIFELTREQSVKLLDDHNGDVGAAADFYSSQS